MTEGLRDALNTQVANGIERAEPSTLYSFLGLIVGNFSGIPGIVLISGNSRGQWGWHDLPNHLVRRGRILAIPTRLRKRFGR